MTPEIRLDSVSARLGQRDFRYDFTLHGPGIVAISGPSGAGKSTLFHLIAGFETPSSGRIVMNGVEMGATPPGRRPLTYMFQDHNLFAHLDLFTNVGLGLSPRLRLDQGDRRAVSAALEDVGLAGFERRMPNSLSGGERQRAAFARALVRARPFLLLDEAFASLDADLRAQMGDLLGALQRRHAMMVLMISHDRSEIARLAEREIEIVNGGNGLPQNLSADASFAK